MPYKEIKRGKKIWVGKVMVDGIRRRMVCATRAEAVQWEAAERKRLKRISSGLTDTDLLTLCNRYLDYIKPRVTPKTFDEKRRLCRTILGQWGNPPVAAVTPEMVSNFISEQAQARSNNAANKDRKNVLALFSWGEKILGLSHNPVHAIGRLPHQRVVQYTPPQEDVLKVLAAATRFERVFLNCYLNTGARRSEILRLAWDDVSFQSRSIVLTTHKTRGGEARRDSLPMNDELYNELKWWWDNRPREHRNQPYIFPQFYGPDERGNNWKGEQRANRLLKRLCKKAGVRPFGYHALRRFVASHLADNEKISSKVIQRILRHQSLATTERYIQRVNKDLLGVLELLPGAGANPGAKRSSKGVNNGV